MTSPGETRRRFAQNISCLPHSALAQLEEALSQIHACEPLYQAIHNAKKQGLIKGDDANALWNEAKQQGIISADEEARLIQAQKTRLQIITVDDFSPELYPS